MASSISTPSSPTTTQDPWRRRVGLRRQRRRDLLLSGDAGAPRRERARTGQLAAPQAPARWTRGLRVPAPARRARRERAGPTAAPPSSPAAATRSPPIPRIGRRCVQSSPVGSPSVRPGANSDAGVPSRHGRRKHQRYSSTPPRCQPARNVEHAQGPRSRSPRPDVGGLPALEAPPTRERSAVPRPRRPTSRIPPYPPPPTRSADRSPRWRARSSSLPERRCASSSTPWGRRPAT